MKNVKFGFGFVLGEVLRGRMATENVDVLVANTAANSAEALAEGYAPCYPGKEEQVAEIAAALFPKMVQYRLAPSYDQRRPNLIASRQNEIAREVEEHATFREAFDSLVEKGVIADSYLSDKTLFGSSAPEYWETVLRESGIL